jgi:Zn-dependent oligopeptidases
MKVLTQSLVFLTMWGCTMTNSDKSNPFFQESDLYLNYPPFDEIKIEHYKPAFIKGMKDQKSEINKIAENIEPPTFENTILAMEKSGAVLDRVATVFYALTSAHTNDDMEKIRADMAPKLSAHSDKILLNKSLFKKINNLYNERNNLDIDPEGIRLIEKYYVDFIRSGAKLTENQKQKLKDLNGEIAVLQTNFSQNVLKEVNELAIIVDDVSELEGLSSSAIQAASNEASSRGLNGKYVIALKNTSGQPSMAS